MDTLRAGSTHTVEVLSPTPVTPTLPPMPSLPKLLTTNNARTISSHDHTPAFHSHMINHVFDSKGAKQTLDLLLANPKTEPIWASGVEKELGQLAQGFENRVTVTDTICLCTRIHLQLHP